jgi:hypothetical protein
MQVAIPIPLYQPPPGVSQELINMVNSFMKLNTNNALREKLNKIDKIIDRNISDITSLKAGLRQFNIIITDNNICINILSSPKTDVLSAFSEVALGSDSKDDENYGTEVN